MLGLSSINVRIILLGVIGISSCWEFVLRVIVQSYCLELLPGVAQTRLAKPALARAQAQGYNKNVLKQNIFYVFFFVVTLCLSTR